MTRKTKKGFFFLIDATLAVVAIILGSFIIYSSFYGQPSVLQLSALADSIVLFYTNNSVEDITFDGYQTLVDCDQPPCPVEDPSDTLGIQIFKWYEQNTTQSMEYVRSFVENVTAKDIPEHINMRLKINDTVVFNTTEPQADVKTIIPSRTLLLYADENLTLHGPVMLEVAVW